MTDAINALRDLAFGYAVQRQNGLEQNSIKLAHYTTAETALKILDGQKLWMRNATVMNDYSEIQHGHEIVSAALDLAGGKKLRRVLGQIDPQLFNIVSPTLNRLSETERSQIFMSSLAEHRADDRLGRLSMWRAYGGSVAGAALVFNPCFFESQHSQFNVLATPVLYGGLDEINSEFGALADRLEQSADLVRAVPIDTWGHIIGAMIRYAFMSLKHAGFEEEREWRLIHLPFRGEGCAWVHDNICAVHGLPQLIYELPLDNIHNGMNFSELNLENALHRIIIGPSTHPETVRQAFVDKLQSLGVKNAGAKVVVSDIPLRH
jgi:Protein of unknown function (DUF2971)